jgi:hypothetical protein
MTFSKLNSAIGATVKTLIACGRRLRSPASRSAASSGCRSPSSRKVGPALVGAAIGWFIAMGLFAHNLDSTKPD